MRSWVNGCTLSRRQMLMPVCIPYFYKSSRWKGVGKEGRRRRRGKEEEKDRRGREDNIYNYDFLLILCRRRKVVCICLPNNWARPRGPHSWGPQSLHATQCPQSHLFPCSQKVFFILFFFSFFDLYFLWLFCGVNVCVNKVWGGSREDGCFHVARRRKCMFISFIRFHLFY